MNFKFCERLCFLAERCPCGMCPFHLGNCLPSLLFSPRRFRLSDGADPGGASAPRLPARRMAQPPVLGGETPPASKLPGGDVCPARSHEARHSRPVVPGAALCAALGEPGVCTSHGQRGAWAAQTFAGLEVRGAQPPFPSPTRETPHSKSIPHRSYM